MTPVQIEHFPGAENPGAEYRREMARTYMRTVMGLDQSIEVDGGRAFAPSTLPRSVVDPRILAHHAEDLPVVEVARAGHFAPESQF